MSSAGKFFHANCFFLRAKISGILLGWTAIFLEFSSFLEQLFFSSSGKSFSLGANFNAKFGLGIAFIQKNEPFFLALAGANRDQICFSLI